MDKYSVLVAVGGDGTYHEVVNGMLHRSDKRRMPVAFIPNGSGNDTLRSFGVTDIVKAMDYIVKGDIIKVDLTKMLMDYEKEEDIADEKERVSNIRYQLINSSFGVPAKINLRASSWKWCCCCNPYQIAAVIEFLSIKYEMVDIIMDGVKIAENIETPFLMCFNGKHGGNGVLLNPLGIINDGLMELFIVNAKLGAKGMLAFMDQAIKEGGVHGYDPNVTIYRGKEFTFVNKKPKTGVAVKDRQVFAIDGEVLYFNDFVKYEVEY